MIDIRLPNITAPTAQGQLEQIKDYLFQLTSQLNFALQAINDNIEGNTIASKENASQGKSDEDKAQDTFVSLKTLIIKSADIVNAYYEEINKRLTGEYVAQSDFGTFRQETEANLSATSTSLTQAYESIQEITDAVNNLSSVRKDNCYIKTGWLDDDETIAGVEIGRTSVVDGVPVDMSFARFTTNRLSFYDINGDEIAWFGNYTMHITNAEISGNLKLGGYLIETANGLSFKWVGR